MLIGGILPLVLLLSPQCRGNRPVIALAAAGVIVGGMAQVYVIIIGGQAFPLSMFPGMTVESGFADGTVASYAPSVYEIGLGIGGVALSLAIVAFAVKILAFLPVSLADADVDPHRGSTT